MKHANRFFILPHIQEIKDFILRRGVSGVPSSHTISDIFNGARELNSEEWLNAGSLRTIKEIVNSDAIKYFTKVLVADGDEQAYFTFLEDCALYFLKKLLLRECLFKVEVTVRFGDHVYTVKNITEDAEMMAQFSSISYAEEEVFTSKNSGTPVNDNDDHMAVIEETSSSSTISEITP
ncbi:hypothetical protein OROHE_005585 [Orobanche hederae]